MRFWFRCSACRSIGTISQDQADGNQYIICGGCSLIRTGILGIRISSERVIDPKTFRTWLDEKGWNLGKYAGLKTRLQKTVGLWL